MPWTGEGSTQADVMLVSCRVCGAFSEEIVCGQCEGLRTEALLWLRNLSDDPLEYAVHGGGLRSGG